MEKVIITGANGFLGTALCRELSRRNIDITAVVRENAGNLDSIKNLPGIHIVYCNLDNYGLLDRIIDDRGFDVLYHLAWEGCSGKQRSDVDVQINNIRQSCEIASMCSKLNCKRLVFAASIMEYEISALMETDKTPGINTIYCSAKLACDYMVRAVAGNCGVEYIRAIISNIYGPGELSPRLISSSLKKMLNGEHCSFSAGDQMYDFIYITDAVKAFVAIGEKGKNNKTYYIGSKKPKPLKEFILEMRDCVDPNIEIGLGELPFDGVSLDYSEIEIDAVEKDTGFQPEETFAQGINKTIAWMRESRI